MTERETFAQWEKRMRQSDEFRVIHTELNDRGGVIHAWCSGGEWRLEQEG